MFTVSEMMRSITTNQAIRYHVLSGKYDMLIVHELEAETWPFYEFKTNKLGFQKECKDRVMTAENDSAQQ